MRILIIFFLFFFSFSQAQESRHEKIRALKTAFITDKLNLTSQEAQKFWPVYNEFEKQFYEIRSKRGKEVYMVLREQWDDLSDDKANQLIDKHLSLEFQELRLLKERTEALRKVIPPKKIIRLNKAEEDFKQELLDQYRKRNKEN